MEAYAADDFGYHPGYVGVFTRGEAPGAYPNGSRIKKVWGEPGDANPLGTEGTVLGSVYHPDHGYAYFVEWDTRPKWAVGVTERKIGPVVTQ